MKKVFSYILIAALFFPLFGHVFAASATDTSDPKALTMALKGIYNRLNDLSNQTQITINQINSSGVVTDQAELDLLNANLSLDKAKSTLDKITPNTDPAAFKTLVLYTETALKDSRTNILTTLSDLKAALPDITTANQ